MPARPSGSSFVREQVPLLEEKGIRVEMCAQFPYHLAEIEDWYGETEQDGGWFTLDLGVIVDGERLSLLPILVGLIATRSDLLSGEALSALPDDELLLYAALPDGRRLPLPAGRVKAILGVLVELNLRELPPRARCGLPLLDAARLSPSSRKRCGGAGSARSSFWRWVGGCATLPASRPFSRPPGCAPSCGLTSFRAWRGCNFCASTSWAASWPTTWGWARRSRWTRVC